MPRLKVIELRDGRPPAEVSGKDITWPIVFMIDGKLPEGLSEQELVDRGATVLSFRSDEPPPRIITESIRQKFADMGISVEKLAESGTMVVDDAVIAAGKTHVDRQIQARLAELSAAEIERQIRWFDKQITLLEEQLLGLRQLRDNLRQQQVGGEK